MKSATRVISILVLFCFVLNTAVSDLAIGQSINPYTNSDKLAVPSELDDIVGIQHKDIGRIQIALEAQLLALANMGLPVNIGTFTTILKEQQVKERTIFNPADIHFFFRDIKLMNNGLRVMCRVKDKNGPRTYYAVFSMQRDAKGGFPIGIYTENEYKKFEKTAKELPQREYAKPEDAKGVKRYIEQNEKAIDAFIQEHIKEGDFAEIENRAKELGWDRSYSGRTMPRTYWTKSFWTKFLSIEWGTGLDEFLKKFGTTFNMVFKGKNIVFIKVPKNVGFPTIHENGQKIIVKSHTSQNAVYFFLNERSFGLASESFDVSKGRAGGAEAKTELAKIAQIIKLKRFVDDMTTLIIHEIGATCGLLSYSFDGKLTNDLDRAWQSPLRNALAEDVFKEFPELNNLKPVNLDTNLPARDYAASGVLQITEEDAEKIINTLQGIVRGNILVREVKYPLNGADVNYVIVENDSYICKSYNRSFFDKPLEYTKPPDSLISILETSSGADLMFSDIRKLVEEDNSVNLKSILQNLSSIFENFRQGHLQSLESQSNKINFKFGDLYISMSIRQKEESREVRGIEIKRLKSSHVYDYELSLKEDGAFSYSSSTATRASASGIMTHAPDQEDPLRELSGELARMELTKKELLLLHDLVTPEHYMTAEELGAKHYNTHRTIHFHIANIYSKFNVTNRIQLFIKIGKLLSEFRKTGKITNDVTAREANLTGREWEVINLIFEGYISREVAEKLYISTKTVDFHLATIYRKCDVPAKQGRLGLVKMLWRGEVVLTGNGEGKIGSKVGPEAQGVENIEPLNPQSSIHNSISRASASGNISTLRENPFADVNRLIGEIGREMRLSEADIKMLQTIETERLDLKIPLRLPNGETIEAKCYVCLDNSALGPHKGGISIGDEKLVYPDEIRAKSRWMSVKNAIGGFKELGYPFGLGGGKSGIVLPPKVIKLLSGSGVDDRIKDSIIRQLAEGYTKVLYDAGLIGPEKYVPAPDIGLDARWGGKFMGWVADTYGELAGKESREVVTGKPMTGDAMDGIRGREGATELGGLYVLQHIMPYVGQLSNKFRALKGFTPTLKEKTIAVQGAGKVGTIAQLLHNEGSKVLAWSDREDAIYDHEGLNVDKLAEYRNYGMFDRAAINGNFPGASQISNEEMLGLDADILVLAATGGVITEKNANDIKAKVIICLANGPITPEAEKILTAKGVLVLPDVMANIGGVTVSFFEMLQNISGRAWTYEETKAKLNDVMKHALDSVVEIAEEQNVSLTNAAYRLAIARILEARRQTSFNGVGAINGEAVSSLQDIMKLVPAEWLDGWLDLSLFASALYGSGCEQNIVHQDDKSVLIFSEKSTFGEYRDGEYEEGIGVLLPSLTKSGIKVAVVAATDKQKALIDGLNEGKPQDQQIVYADSVSEIKAKTAAARYYYFKVASEPDAGTGVTSITIIVKKIIEAIGHVAQITDNKLIEQMHEAARQFAAAA